MKTNAVLVFSALLSLSSVAAQAGPIQLTFEGLLDLEQVEEYYNGGVGGFTSGPGPNYGVSFPAYSALSLASGPFGNQPTPNVLYFYFATDAAKMNIPAGFDTLFSFYYTAKKPGSVTLYDGLNGTGNVLATVALPVTPNPGYVWVSKSVGFSGTAKSVDFIDAAWDKNIYFDNLTLGSATSIPEPSSLVLLAMAAVGFVFGTTRRRRGSTR